jgi:hypothetical protein
MISWFHINFKIACKMTIVLYPGFSGSIIIQNEEGEGFYGRGVSTAGAVEFIDQYDVSGSATPFWKASLIPLRMDNWCHFASDFFFPTLVNHAIKVDHIVLRMFALVFSIIFDIVTFLSRLVTCPFQIFNHFNARNDHDLVRLTSRSNQVINSDVLTINVRLKRVDIEDDSNSSDRIAKKSQ